MELYQEEISFFWELSKYLSMRGIYTEVYRKLNTLYI